MSLGRTRDPSFAASTKPAPRNRWIRIGLRSSLLLFFFFALLRPPYLLAIFPFSFSLLVFGFFGVSALTVERVCGVCFVVLSWGDFGYSWNHFVSSSCCVYHRCVFLLDRDFWPSFTRDLFLLLFCFFLKLLSRSTIAPAYWICNACNFIFLFKNFKTYRVWKFEIIVNDYCCIIKFEFSLLRRKVLNTHISIYHHKLLLGR